MSTRRASEPDTATVIRQWDDWLATATDRLMSLDERVTTAGDDLPDAAQASVDIAAAYLCRKAVAARVDEIRSRPAEAKTLSASPVVDDAGQEVAADLATAAALLGGVLDRVEADVTSVEQSHHSLVVDRAAAESDLATAERLAVELGHFAQRCAGLRERAASAGRSTDEWRAVASEAASIRGELERIDAVRRTSFDRWRELPASLAALRARESEVRELVDLVRSKVRPAPNLAVPSVAALAEARPLDELSAMPWPAARAAMEPYLTRVERLGAAFEEVARRHQAALDRRNELRGLLHAFRDKAAGSGLGEDAALEPLFRAAERELWSAPCDLDASAILAQDYIDAVNRAVDPADDRVPERARERSSDRGEDEAVFQAADRPSGPSSGRRRGGLPLPRSARGGRS
jgi:hypothetical protein